MDKFVINSSGTLIAFTEDKVTRPGDAGTGLLRQAWRKSDVVDIALWNAKKVVRPGLSIRTDTSLTFVLADGSTRSYTAKNTNPDEVTFALRMRGWPVNGVRRAAPADDDPTAALKKLLTLQEHGLVTEDEYEAKRAEVLARI